MASPIATDRQVHHGNTYGGHARVHAGDVHGNVVNDLSTHHHYHGVEDELLAGGPPGPGHVSHQMRAITTTRARKVRKALFLSDPRMDRETLIVAKGDRVPGTCEWIRNNQLYKEWLQGQFPVLWISGDPGKGKTMMSLFLSEELEKMAANDKETIVLYYYCSYQEANRNRATDLLRSLILQLIAGQDNVAADLAKHFETSEREAYTLSSVEILWTLFETCLNHKNFGATVFRQVYCVIDGLDECDEASSIHLVRKICDKVDGKDRQDGLKRLHLAMVSRDVASVSKLQQVPRLRLDPDNDHIINEDIRTFVSEKTKALSSLPGFNDHFRSQIESLIMDQAAGTFLWVGFAMHELLQKRTCTEVLQTMRTLPPGLDAIYRRMLDRVSENHKDVAARILRWIVLSESPLTLGELLVAIQVRPEPPLSEEQCILDHITICSPMVRIIRGGRRTVIRMEGNRPVYQVEDTVSLIHQSANEYLLGKSVNDRKQSRGIADIEVPEEFRIVPEQAHLEFSKTCVQRLENSILKQRELRRQSNFRRGAWKESTSLKDFPEITHWAFLDENDRALVSVSPLLCYAVDYWHRHAMFISEAEQALWSSFSFFRRDDQTFRHLVLSMTHDELEGLEKSTPFARAAALGIISWARAIIAEECSKNPANAWKLLDDQSDASHRTPLSLAISRRQTAMACLLIKWGADVHARDGDGRRPLHFAASSGDVKVIETLFAHGAEPNPLTKAGQTPLDYLVQNFQGDNRTQTVQKLRERGTILEAELEVFRRGRRGKVRNWLQQSMQNLREQERMRRDARRKEMTIPDVGVSVIRV